MEIHKESFDLLSCGEISSLWIGYQYESLHRCGITFFLQHVKDDHIRKILEDALTLTNKRIEHTKELFMKYDQLLPIGFSVESDVNIQAPRLFSDELYLHYITNTIQLELVNYTLSMRGAMNQDILTYYHQVIKDSLRMELKAKDISKEKGLYIPS